MSEEQSTNGLNNKLVFSRFVKLAERREALYYDFIEIDEPDEIGNAWVEFSGKVVEDLLSVIKLNRNLFERFVDELRRTPDEPDPKGFDRIRNLTEFWLDLSVMSYLYATINKRGVLDQPGIQKNSKGYMDTKKSIDDLIILAFQTGQEFFSIDARLILSEVLSLDQEKKRLDFFDEMEDMEEEKFHLLGKYDQEQASFLMTRVKDRLIHSSTSWWWNDPIGLHSAAEHAISHINSMITNWNHSSSDLQEKGKKFYESTYPIARIFSDVALAQHYRRLALSALRARATAVASEYFAKAEALTSSLGIETLSLIDNLDFFKPSIQDQLLIYKHMQHLSTISQKYHSIIHYLLEGKIEEIKILVPEILDKLSKILVEGDIAYVSSVAVAYEGVFAYILEQLENNTKPEKIVNFVQKRINTLADRLHSASHQKTKNWLKLVQKNPEDVRSLRELTSNISLTLMSIYILPPDLDVVIPITSELLAVQNATEALVISAEANAEFGKNPVKEMLMRAKTYRLVEEAKKFLVETRDEETVTALKNVLDPLGENALLRGLIAEVQMKSAVLQYHFINTIARLIESSVLSKIDAEIVGPFDEKELNLFIEELEELNIASISIEEHKAPINIGGQPLNWNYINRLRYYSSGLIELIKSVQFAINAGFSIQNDIDEAIVSWDSAKTLAYKSAEIVAQAKTKDSENLAQQVYSLAQIYHGFENKSRDRKAASQFPVDGLVELVQALVMGI